MSLGPIEILLIVVVIALLFGAKKLPELMKGMGKGVREFKAEVSDLNRTDHPDSVPPAALSERPTEPVVLIAEPRRTDVVAQPGNMQTGERR